jgi:flagellar assembly factor FliW
MEIQSKLLGSQQVNPDSIITFPRGLPGFENRTRFQLFHQEGSDIVYWLQSLDDDNLTFSVAHPLHFHINYNFVLTDEETKLLEAETPEDLLILILLHQDEDQENGTPTIKGSIKSPLLINSKKRVGYQKVMVLFEQSITLTERTASALSEASSVG